MRDIVQFVPFRNVGMNQDLLAKQLLAEVPGQVTSFMVIFYYILEFNWQNAKSTPLSQF